MSLNLSHIDCIGTGFFTEDDTVTGSARLVGCTKAIELGIDLCQQFLISAETAGSKNNSLSVNGLNTILVLVLNSDNLAVLNDQLLSLSVGSDVNAFVLSGSSKSLNNVGSDEATARRTVRTLVSGTGHHTDISQVSAGQRVDEVNRVSGVVGKNMNEVRIVQVLAALHRVIEMGFDGVFNTGLSLRFGFSSVQTAGCAVCIAADKGHFFKNDDLFTQIMSGHCGGETGTAGTDNDHISVICGSCRNSKSGRNHGSQKDFFHLDSPR